MPSHRELAKRKTRAWQMAVIAFLGVGAALIALPIGRLLGPSHPVTTIRPSEGPSVPGGNVVAVAIDVSSAAQVLRYKNLNPIVPKDKDGAAKPTDEPPQPPQPPTPEPNRSEWTYLGSIVTPRTRHALVKVNDQQSLLGEGQMMGNTKLLSVEADHIMIQDGAMPKRVDLAATTATWAIEPRRAPMAARPNAAPEGKVPRPSAFGAGASPGGNGGLGGWSPPPMDPDRRLEILKILPEGDEGERMAIDKELNIPHTATPLERMGYYKQLGVDLNSPLGKQLMEEVERGGGK